MIETFGFTLSFAIGTKSCKFYWTYSRLYFKQVLN